MLFIAIVAFASGLLTGATIEAQHNVLIKRRNQELRREINDAARRI